MQFEIKNKQARMLGICGRMLRPGVNSFEVCDAPVGDGQISQDTVDRIVASQVLATWVKLGWVVVAQEASPVSHNATCDLPVGHNETEAVDDELAPEAYPADLSHLKLLQAKEFVASCSDADALLRWFDNDSRSGVKKAIEARLDELAP